MAMLPSSALQSRNNRFELAYLLPSPYGDEPRYRRFIKRRWWFLRWEHWDDPGMLYSAAEVDAILKADNDNNRT